MKQTRTAIVTGASRGIGRGIAVELGRGGWRVAVNYASSAEAADQTVAMVEAVGGQAVAVRGDVGVSDDRRAMLGATLEAFGRIDLLVNNAGITSPDRDKDLLDATEAGYDKLMAVNLKGPHFLTQLVANWMKDHPAPDGDVGGAGGTGGTGGFRAIVNLSSISAYAVSTNRADYCMAKAAIGMMTRVWATRLAEYGVAVYEVRPGVIESDMTAGVREKYDRLIHEQGTLPTARWGTAQDVGRAVAMLASGSLAYSTGQTIEVDGGFHIRRL